ncbi:MAG: cell division protein FtsA [Verrucomicrobiales bacterium]|nr:cell division protein FtsA [Verrucomicrobiales bacterium]
MFDLRFLERRPLIVGLEIGTAKVCAMVGEINAEGALTIIGIGQSPSRGVRKGEIVEPSLAEEDVRAALSEAEHSADVEVRSVYLGVSGGHVVGFNNRGVQPIVSRDREIGEDDVNDVIRNAKAINIPAEHYVVHAIRQHFSVDDQDEIRDPVGMIGGRLEVEMHVIHGRTNRFQNAIRLVKGMHLEVEDIVFNGLASALGILTAEQKELGALVIDLGAGSTEYVVYSRGVVKHTGVLAVGGDHVSQDIALGLKVPQGRAEKLKFDHGDAIFDEAARGLTHTPHNDLGLPERPLNIEHLRCVMSLRLQETFEIIREEVDEAGWLNQLRGGVFICGGGARIPRILELAERVFELPAFPGHARGINGLASALDQPEFSTAIGLVKFGAGQARKKNDRGGLRRLANWSPVRLFSQLI